MNWRHQQEQFAFGVWIPSTPFTLFHLQAYFCTILTFCWEENEIKQKEAGFWLYLKNKNTLRRQNWGLQLPNLNLKLEIRFWLEIKHKTTLYIWCAQNTLCLSNILPLVCFSLLFIAHIWWRSTLLLIQNNVHLYLTPWVRSTKMTS